MARHNIYPNPHPDGSDAEGRIELAWQRELGVQLGTTKRPESGTGEPEWSGQFVDLTRDQINHLIKQLRAARDQAFGRDE